MYFLFYILNYIIQNTIFYSKIQSFMEVQINIKVIQEEEMANGS